MPFVVTRPPQKNVAGRLQHPLPGYDSFAVVGISALACVRVKNGRERFLELQEQWVVLASHEQNDRAAGPDAADSYDLSGDIDDLIAIENDAPLFRQRQPMTVKHFSHSFSELNHLARVVDKR